MALAWLSFQIETVVLRFHERHRELREVEFRLSGLRWQRLEVVNSSY